ncbi:hypothetical protein ACET3Z_025525 [Daucus carota]
MEWLAERHAFSESKGCVKELADAGITKLPPMFIDPKAKFVDPRPRNLTVPVIDLKHVSTDAVPRAKAVEQVQQACEKFGFFQLVNHGIPASVMDEMLEGVRRFNEQDSEVKKQFYSRDKTRTFSFCSNFGLFSRPEINWKDSIHAIMAPNPSNPEQYPPICRHIMTEYASYVMELGISLLELFSEGLGLQKNYLKEMDCAKGLVLMGHYSPKCPEPELTLGNSSHTDNSFFTILLQDQIGGLQILYENQWFNVLPMPGALLVNIGDLMQLISNDKLRSVKHRVLANRNSKARISVACFFREYGNEARKYGPIKELISDENPPVYREMTMEEFYKSGNEYKVDALSFSRQN